MKLLDWYVVFGLTVGFSTEWYIIYMTELCVNTMQTHTRFLGCAILLFVNLGEVAKPMEWVESIRLGFQDSKLLSLILFYSHMDIIVFSMEKLFHIKNRKNVKVGICIYSYDLTKMKWWRVHKKRKDKWLDFIESKFTKFCSRLEVT